MCAGTEVDVVEEIDAVIGCGTMMGIPVSSGMGKTGIEAPERAA